MQEAQGVRADSGMAERGVNTDQDWESQVAAMLEYGASLAERYDGLLKQQEQEEAEHQKHKAQLEKKKDDGTRQKYAVLDKLRSLRVKLELNDSKATRKNFLPKKQEMMSEKNRAEEERNRLAKELGESEKKLTLLTEEQREEQRKWQEELEELKREMELRRKEAAEAELVALQDEIAAVEKQREISMARIEAWLKEVGQYLNVLRLDHSQQHLHKKMEWEKQESLVRKNQVELQSRFKEVIQQLQQGRELETLPRINLPTLPQVPTVDLMIGQMMMSLTPPPPANPGSLVFNPHQQRHPFLPHQYQSQFHPQFHPQFRPQFHPQFQHQYPPQFPPQPQFRPPVRVTPPPDLSPSPPFQALHPVTPSPPPSTVSAPAGKLDKVLEKLGTRFPQCTRPQLTSLLQQIKSSRGTLAGMSMEEVIEQVGFKLAQNERPAPGPISRPTAPRAFPGVHAPPLGPIQRPLPAMQRPAAPGQVFPTKPAAGSRKLCLMCQNHVDPGSRHPLSCSHTVHKDCISVWLQSSSNNSCPFCPSK
ncbi:RING finger protein 214 [Diretmus argenteus]